jgi:hypothetical protein
MYTRDQGSWGNHPKMIPTPNAWDSARGPRSQESLKNNPKGQINILTAIKDYHAEKPVHEWMYPTPNARDYRDTTLSPANMNRKSDTLPIKIMKQKPGGKLNPNFLEFLMGYPQNWTQIETKE